MIDGHFFNPIVKYNNRGLANGIYFLREMLFKTIFFSPRDYFAAILPLRESLFPSMALETQTSRSFCFYGKISVLKLTGK